MENAKDKKPRPEGKSYIRYTGVAFQLLITIALFSFIGYKLDERNQNDKPILTAVLGLTGVVVALIQVVKSLPKP